MKAKGTVTALAQSKQMLTDAKTLEEVLKLNKCSGLQNVADALTKSLPSPSFVKHQTYLWGSRIPFEAFRVKMLHHHPSVERTAWLAFHARVHGA